MIDKREIIEAASSFSLLFNVVGKEIMSWAGYSPHRYGVPHLVVAKVEILAVRAGGELTQFNFRTTCFERGLHAVRSMTLREVSQAFPAVRTQGTIVR